MVCCQCTRGRRRVQSPAKLLREAIDRPALARQVELGADRPGELRDEAGRLVEIGVGKVAFGEPRELPENGKVALDRRVDAGAAHFDRHLVARVKPRAVHLRDRGSRDRLGIEAGEQRVDRRPELRLDGRLCGPGRQGRDLVLQARKLGDEVVGQQVRPRAERLAELDEGRPQFLERHAGGAAPWCPTVRADARSAGADRVRPCARGRSRATTSGNPYFTRTVVISRRRRSCCAGGTGPGRVAMAYECGVVSSARRQLSPPPASARDRPRVR